MCATDNGDPSAGPAETVKQLEALIGQEHVSEQYVRFRIDVLKAQWAVHERLVSASPATTATTESLTGAGGNHRASRWPALDPDAVPFDGELLEGLLTALGDAVTQRGRESADVSRLARTAQDQPGLLEELARKAAFGPDREQIEALSRRLEVSVDPLLFFGRVLAAPFVSAAARRVRERLGPPAGPDSAGLCSICGSPPGLAKLRRDDGWRILCCSLCGAHGEFKRLRCPYCGSSDEGALKVLRITETDPRWIETCESCRGYIKTVDERRLPVGSSVIAVVEETGTLHLDLLAEQEGYARRLPYAAMS